MTGSDTFIMVALRCSDSSRPLGLRVVDLLLVEAAQRVHVHHGGVEDLALQQGHLLLEHRHRAVGGHELVAHLGGLRRWSSRSRCRRSRRRSCARRGDFESARQAPSLCGCFFENAFTESGRPAVGVALAEHRVDGAAQHLRVARLDGLLGVVFRRLGVVRHVVALALELPDGLLELRNRGRDVGQLDDVGLGLLRQLAELRRGSPGSAAPRSGVPGSWR